MSALRIAISAAAEGPMGRLSSAFPGALLEGTPVGASLLIRCRGDASKLKNLEDRMASRFVTRYEVDGESVLTMVAALLPSEAKLLKALRDEDLVLLPPLIWRAGRIQVRLLAFKNPGDRAIVALKDARVMSKIVLGPQQVEDELRSSGLMLPDLTMKQGQAILAAFEAGYYDSPRRSTAGEVARGLGVARSTFEESLRSAESQMVRAVAPLVRVRLLEMEQGRREAGAEALHLYARFSEDLGLYVNMALRENGVTSVSLTTEAPEASHGTDHPYLARMIEHLSSGEDDLRDIPVDLRVSPFDREVLVALREIPTGEVVTYGEVASRLGRPRAARAVGSACARNPIPLIIPCHRVVPAAGGLGNYSGGNGPATKAAILEREGVPGKKVKGGDR
ncbi:MAG: methylated-DNA--[protein]-cysteine S-methyltransferase [Methanomassiliicoccus sp.]|nr:methylated-DNA--[protein]-cysteine S-methyltransferase [Methanomassiliicoccus sp.]